MGLIALEKTEAVDSASQQRRATRRHATFGRFAELDSPVTMTTRPTDAPTAADDDGTVRFAPSAP